MSKKDQPYTSQLKGVAALLGDSFNQTQNPANSANTVAIYLIKLPQSQPRRYFDPQKLEELSRSIKELGILEPLLVRPLEGGNYELVAGERRYRAASMAGLTEIPVVIREMDDAITYQVRLVENLQREDLNPLEETEGILELLVLRLEVTLHEIISHLNRMRNVCDRYDENSELRHNVMSQPETKIIEELFSTLGRMSWQSFVKNRLPLLNLPADVLFVLRQGQLEYTKARAIAKVKEDVKRAPLLQAAIKENLSLTEIQLLIRDIFAQEKADTTPSLKTQYKELSKQLGSSKVWDNPKKKKALEKLLNQIKVLLDEEQAITKT